MVVGLVRPLEGINEVFRALEEGSVTGRAVLQIAPDSSVSSEPQRSRRSSRAAFPPAIRPRSFPSRFATLARSPRGSVSPMSNG